MHICPISWRIHTPNKSILAVGWVIKYLIDGSNYPWIAAFENTNKNANLFAAVNKWFDVGLNVTFEKACESLKNASDTIDTKIITYPIHTSVYSFYLWAFDS